MANQFEMRIELNNIFIKPRINKLMGNLIFELTGKRNRLSQSPNWLFIQSWQLEKNKPISVSRVKKKKKICQVIRDTWSVAWLKVWWNTLICKRARVLFCLTSPAFVASPERKESPYPSSSNGGGKTKHITTWFESTEIADFKSSILSMSRWLDGERRVRDVLKNTAVGCVVEG